MLQSDFLKTFLVGSTSGSISAFLCQPLDVLKTRFQKNSKNTIGNTSYVFILKDIYRTEGISGFWMGLSPALMRTVPGVGLYFSILHYLNENVVSEKPTVVQTILVSCAARGLATICFIPFTVLKTRYESGEYNYRGLLHAMRNIREKEGFRGFTRGLLPTLIRDVPFSGIYYLFYTRTKTLIGTDNVKEKSSLKLFLSGITAGCLASVITHPADVIKTFMQLYPNEFRYFSSGINFIYLKFGISGYFKGIMVRMFRRTLVTSLSWTVYEKIKDYINEKS